MMTLICWICSLAISLTCVDAGAVVLEAPPRAYHASNVTIIASLVDAERQYYKWTFTITKFDGTKYYRYHDGYSRRKQITEIFGSAPGGSGKVLVEVEVSYINFIIPQQFGANKTTIVVSDEIPVSMRFEQDGTVIDRRSEDDPNLVTVSSSVSANASVIVEDVGDYFKNLGASFSIYWALNDDNEGITSSSFIHSYPSNPNRTTDVLRAVITASKDNKNIATGKVSTSIQAKAPITNLTVDGSLWLRRGQITRLKFYCDGSPPIKFCWKANSIPTNGSDFICQDADYSDSSRCQFEAVRYFSGIGDHQVLIKVKNVINDVLYTNSYNASFKVHIYDVASEGLLHLFIVPISCFIIGVVILVSAVALYKHTKGDIRVEVADFDFGGASTSQEIDAVLEERTFWSHIRDELAESHKVFGWLARSPRNVFEELSEPTPESPLSDDREQNGIDQQ